MEITGGFFMSGSKNIFRGKYFMDENIVLVTMNYRLGALGK
jgi:carboxylesterase type B